MRINSIPEISLRRLEKIIKGVRRYSFPTLDLSWHRGEVYGVHAWSNYDGYPFADVLELSCFPKGKQSGDYNNLYWIIKICYSGTHGEEYDYEANCKRDDSTPWKRRTDTREEKTRFKLDDDYSIEVIALKAENRERQIFSDLIALERYLEKIDENTQDLSCWAKSGLDMLVNCKYCYRQSRITNHDISAYADRGLCIVELRKKLTCSTCGSKNSHLIPPLLGQETL